MNPKGRTTLMAISSAVLAVAPKCPICFFAYFGLFGVASSTVAAYRVWMPPLTALWLAMTVGLMLMGRRGRRSWGPPLAGLAAAIVVFAGKFALDRPVLVYAGIAALASAVVWNAFSASRASAAQCSECDESSFPLDQEAC
jgi:hypothetical protein